MDRRDQDRSLAADLMDSLLVHEASTPIGLEILAPGTIVAKRYQILALVGQGGMGSVYRAYDPELDRSIALKILTHQPDKGQGIQTHEIQHARYLQEAQSLAKLSHPNVVAVHDVGTHGDFVFIAMEFVEGKTLADWIRAHQPSRKQVLEVLLAAGKGLSAAHQAGLVHLDFKPANVIIGVDSRVRVIDFGLARGLDTSEGQVGFVGGTPLYMAPEQFRDGEVDNKADQYSFCIVLHEVLCGERPDRTWAANPGQVLRSGLDPKIPAWISRILERGLAFDHAGRYADMDALLYDLQKDPAVRRKKGLLTVLVMLALAFGAYGVASELGRGQQLCQGAEERIARVWSPSSKRAIQVAFGSTGLPLAQDSFERVTRHLDRFAHDWAEMFTEACTATRIEGVQTEDLLQKRMECLHAGFRDFHALVEVLASAKRKTVQHSISAVMDLPALSRCADIDVLSASGVVPPDPAIKGQLDELNSRLAKSRALARTDEMDEAIELAGQVTQEARDLGYSPFLAKAVYWLSSYQWSVGKYRKAEQDVFEALCLADEAGYDALRARAAIALIKLTGVRSARPEEGQRWQRQARAALQRLGQDQEILSMYHLNSAMLELARGEYARAIDDYQKVVDLSARWSGSGHPPLTSGLNGLGTVYKNLGQYERAKEYFSRSLKINLRDFGPQHTVVAQTLNNLGVALKNLGDYEQAIKHYLRALDIWEKTMGPEFPEVARVLNNLGTIYNRQGDYVRALEYHQRSLKIRRQAFGDKHPDVARSLKNLGAIHLAQGQFDQAMDYFSQALGIREKILGPEHPLVAYLLIDMASVLLETKRPIEANDYLDRALAICEQKGCPGELKSHARFTLARALWAQGIRRPKVLRLAKQALDDTPEVYADLRVQIQAWIRHRETAAGHRPAADP